MRGAVSLTIIEDRETNEAIRVDVLMIRDLAYENNLNKPG